MNNTWSISEISSVDYVTVNYITAAYSNPGQSTQHITNNISFILALKNWFAAVAEERAIQDDPIYFEIKEYIVENR